MSKAYNRVEWPFLRAIMIKLGFPISWVEQIMNCISTSNLAFLVNGELMGEVTPSRGLRQGCPLSTYLFLICVEGFSSLLQKMDSERRLVGVTCARGAPRTNHLLFADKNIIFGKADEGNVLAIKEVLNFMNKARGKLLIFRNQQSPSAPT